MTSLTTNQSNQTVLYFLNDGIIVRDNLNVLPHIFPLFDLISCVLYRMIGTITKLGEGAFADVFGCQKEGWDKLAIKVKFN